MQKMCNHHSIIKPKSQINWSELFSIFTIIINKIPLKHMLKSKKRRNRTETSQQTVMNQSEIKIHQKQSNHPEILQSDVSLQLKQPEQTLAQLQIIRCIDSETHSEKQHQILLEELKQMSQIQTQTLNKIQLQIRKLKDLTSDHYQFKEYKDRLIQIDFINLFKHVDPESKAALTRTIPKIIGQLIDRLCKEAFIGIYKGEMETNQDKIYFCNNLILNCFEIVKVLEEKGLENQNPNFASQKVIKVIEDSIVQSIKFLKLKYPQKQIINIDEKQVSEQVDFVIIDLLEGKNKTEVEQKFQKYKKQDKIELLDINTIDKLGFTFFVPEKDSQVELLKQVKIFINRIIQQSNTKFQQYKETMLSIFSREGKGTIPNKIGSKLKEHTKLLNVDELAIKIQDLAILRIIMKWNEQLQKIVKALSDSQYLNKINKKFYTKKRNLFNFDPLSLVIISQQFEQYKQKYSDQQKVNMQNILAFISKFVEQNKGAYPFIGDQYIKIGMGSDIVSKLVCDKSISKLIYQLKLLLGFSRFISNNKNKLMFSKENIHVSQFNFIEFTVSDIFRCKCTANIEEIIFVFRKLIDCAQIIRIKNRLNTTNMDILVNYCLKDIPFICEIQLGLQGKHKQNNKQQFLNHFNHFLYELERSQYGPLTQAGLINTNYNKTVKYFFENIKKQKRKQRASLAPQQIYLDNHKIQPRVDLNNRQIAIDGFKTYSNTFAFICVNCLRFVQSYQTHLKVFVNRNKSKIKYCGECVVKSLTEQDRRKVMLKYNVDLFFKEILRTEIDMNSTYNYYIVISNRWRNHMKMYGCCEQGLFQRFNYYIKQHKFFKPQDLDIQFVYKLQFQDLSNNYLRFSEMQQAINKCSSLEYQLMDNTFEEIQKMQAEYKFQKLAVLQKEGHILLINFNRNGLLNKIKIKDKQTKQQEIKKSKTDGKIKIINVAIQDQVLENYIDFYKDGIDQIHLQNCDIKKIKWIKGLHLKKLTLIELQKLETTIIFDKKLDLTLLENLTIMGTPIERLHIGQAPSLELNLLINTQLGNLEILELRDMKIPKCLFEEFNNKIKTLILSTNSIEQITFRKPLKYLQRLNLKYNNIKQFPYILVTDTIKEMYFYENKIEKVVISKSAKNLQILRLDHNFGLRQFQFLIEKNSLKWLHLEGDKLLNIFRISNCAKQTEIKCQFEFQRQGDAVVLKQTFITENN